MADDLLGIIDTAGARINQESMDFQTDIAEGLMAASGGEITGFEVTRTDDPARGIHRTETVFDRASRNLNLVADVNPEQEAAALRVSRERGIPLPLARSLDNREMRKPDLRAMAPETLAFFGDDLSNAAVAKDDVDGIDNIVAAAGFSSLSPEERREAVLEEVKRNGYSASRIADLKAAGYSPLPDDPSGANGVFSVDSMQSLNAKVKWPVLENWYSGPCEADQAEREREAAERFDKVFRHGFDNVRGSAWLVNATPETAAKYIQTLDEEIATMRGLYAMYGAAWKEFDDRELASVIGEVGKTFGFDTGRVSPARLRPAGVGWETDWEQALNVFGTFSAYESRTKLSQEELDEVHRNPLAFTPGDRAELVDELENQARDLRGMTGWNRMADALVGSARYMTEFAATSGVSAAPSALKAALSGGWLKGVPRVFGLLLKGEAKRLPAYLPKAGLETWEDTRARVSQVVQNGAVLPGMTEDQTSEVANVFFNKVLDTYVENVSEGMGALMPGTGRLFRPLVNAVPQRLKNAAFAQVAKSVLKDVAASKGAKVANIVYERSMFNGLLGEYTEEKWGDAVRAFSTELARAVGTEYGDLGQEGVFGTLEEELQLMGTLVAAGAVLQSVRIPTAVGDIRRAVRFMDAHRAVHTAVEEAKTTRRDPESIVRLLQSYTRGSNVAYLSPEGARSLFQSAPEMLGRIGISEDAIGEAETAGRMIPVSMPRVHAYVSRAELDTLLPKLVPDPKSSLTPEDAEKIDLSEEARKVAEETDRVRAETKAAYDEAIARLTSLGRPATEIRAASKLLSMAEYFGQHSDMTSAEWIRNVAFQKVKEEDFLKALAGKSDELYQAKVNESGVKALLFLAEQMGITPDSAAFAFLSGTGSMTENGRTVHFDRGTRHAIGQHVIEAGMSPKVGGLTLGEVAEYLPLTLAKGKRTFDKKEGRAVYFFTPENSSHGYKLVTRETKDGREYLVTFSSTRRARQTKKMAEARRKSSEKESPTATPKPQSGNNIPPSLRNVKLNQSDLAVPRPEIPPLSAEDQAEVDRQRAEVRARYEGTDLWLKAPNGKPTNLTEDLWVTVRTPYFKKWFGDWEGGGAADRASHIGEYRSVSPRPNATLERVSNPHDNNTPEGAKSQIGLLDENGEPLVVHHGTASRFTNFRFGDTGFHFGNREQAEFRAKDMAEKAEYAGVYSGFITLKNPLYIPEDFGDWSGAEFAKSLLESRHLPLSPKDRAELEEIKSVDDWERGNRRMRQFLQDRGYDGVVYENNPVEDGGEGHGRSYVIFDASQFKSVDNLGTFNPDSRSFYYQIGTPNRGAFTPGKAMLEDESFSSAWGATITLFEGAADASTLVHETAHYAFEMMRNLVRVGAADERMQADFAKLQAWAENGESDPIAQKERLARAFEAYCMEGKAPSIELEGAFATLRRLLLHVYRSVKALGVELTDEVRTVFDGMLASDETLNNESILREVASQINKELLGLTQAEVKVFRDLIEKSNAQAIAKLTAEKNARLAKLRPQWRQEAKDLMTGDRVYNAWNAIQNEGGIDYVALEEICGEHLASKLRRKGLTTNPGRKSKAKVDKKTGEVIRPAGYYSAKSGKHPASFAAENGFESVEQMVDELSYAKSPKDFTAEYMADAEQRFHAEFEIPESALSVQASFEALERLSGLLAVKGGKRGFAIRRAMLKHRALEEINGMRVGEIESSRKLIADCRMNARKLTKAANDGDFATAFDQAQKLRYNLEVLRHIAEAKKAVARTEKLLYRARHAKKGSIYGDHQEALKDLSFRFGFTRTEPKDPQAPTAASVIDGYNKEARENNEPTFDAPAWLLAGSRSFRDLTFGELQVLTRLADFLYSEGRALVAAREKRLKERVRASVEACVAELAPQKHRFINNQNTFVHGWRSVVQWGTKLRNIFGMAAKWKKDSEFQKLYDEMAYAASEHTQLMEIPLRQAGEALAALYKATRNLPLETIGDIRFPPNVIAENYRKWDAEKVIAACLNMGTFKNRQRLIDGYEWGENGEEYCNRIASLLTAEDWGNIQKIWNAVGRGNLSDRVKQTFKEERHFDLKEEEALPFTVHTSDGIRLEMAGGYYPLDYLYHKNQIAQSRTEAGAQYNPPAFRRASFTFERAESVSDPLRLSLNLIFTHIYDAAHYVSHRAVMRKVMRVINDSDFRSHFQQTQGFERYDALKALIGNVAAPGAALKGMTSEFENWGRAMVTASALWASPSVVFMQLSSVTVGLDELGTYWTGALAESIRNPREVYDFVMSHSGMMRDRVNTKDLDLRTRANRFQESELSHIRRVVTEIGYQPMRFVDLMVAIPAWRAAFYQAKDRGMGDSHAAAVADEFVAKTQGATRAIDMSPLQLKAWGRGVTVFFSAVSAGATTASRTYHRIVTGDLKGAAAMFALGCSVLCPMFISGTIRWALAGAGSGDDPDKANRALLRELVTNPFQGIPVVRDIADFAAGKTVGKSGYAQRTLFENTAFRGISDLFITAFEGIAAAADGNGERALYKLSDAAGMLFRVPVIRVYERARRILVDWTNDPELLPDFDKETKKRK